MRLSALSIAFCAGAVSARAAAGSEFLRLPAGARHSALGESCAGLNDGPAAMGCNPAGMAWLDRGAVGLSHNALAGGVNHEWGGVAHPAGPFVMGAAFSIVTVAPFEAYDGFDRPSGQTSSSDASYQVSAAVPVLDAWAFGCTAKHLSSRLHDRHAAGYAADAGVAWRPRRWLGVGAAVQNLGSGLRFVSERDPLPTAWRFGLSSTPLDPALFGHFFTAVLDARRTRDEPWRLSGGIELWYEGLVALRAGIRSGATGQGLSLGAGLRLFHDDRSRFEIGVDYAFADSGDFARTHRVEVGLRFGRAAGGREPSYAAPREEFLREGAPLPRRGARPSRPSTKRSADPILYPDFYESIKP